jgi:hypothetical protein
MKPRPGAGAGTRHSPGVVRDLGLYEHDVEHDPLFPPSAEKKLYAFSLFG